MLIENFRPGVMARLGLDAATCHDLNRGLVYCSLPGFSELDERAGVAGWEGVVMAAGGAYARQASSPVFGGATGEMPDFPSLPLASCFAAGMTALSACAALIARERDGGLGQRIEIPLSDALLEGSGILTTRVEKQAPMRGGVFAPGLYRSRDDQVMCFTSGAHRHLVGLARDQRQRGLDRGRLGGLGRPAHRSGGARRVAGEAGQPVRHPRRRRVGGAAAAGRHSDRPAADHPRVAARAGRRGGGLRDRAGRRRWSPGADLAAGG